TQRYSLPEGCGSFSPVSIAFSETPRRISLLWNTSKIASTRSGALATITTASWPLQEIEAPTPRKSYRWDTSLAVWLSALSTSCRSTLLTTSNEESLATEISFTSSHRRTWAMSRTDAELGIDQSGPLTTRRVAGAAKGS